MCSAVHYTTQLFIIISRVSSSKTLHIKCTLNITDLWKGLLTSYFSSIFSSPSSSSPSSSLLSSSSGPTKTFSSPDSSTRLSLRIGLLSSSSLLLLNNYGQKILFPDGRKFLNIQGVLKIMTYCTMKYKAKQRYYLVKLVFKFSRSLPFCTLFQ